MGERRERNAEFRTTEIDGDRCIHTWNDKKKKKKKKKESNANKKEK